VGDGVADSHEDLHQRRQVVPGSFVDEALSERHSDLLYEVRLGRRRALVYLLFEHQSTVEAGMALRLLRYMVRIWTRWVDEDGWPAPVIVPCILYHGDARWTASTAFEALVDLGEDDEDDETELLLRHVPRFAYLVDDLSADSDESLRARAMTAMGLLALLLLKNARHRPDLLDCLATWADAIREVLRAPDGLRALEAFVRYILEVSDHVTPEAIEQVLVAEVGAEAREAVMTAARRLIEQGREEGREEGLKHGQQLLLRQLRLKFGAPLPPAIVTRVEQGRGEQLDRWGERLLTVDALEQVFEEPTP